MNITVPLNIKRGEKSPTGRSLDWEHIMRQLAVFVDRPTTHRLILTVKQPTYLFQVRGSMIAGDLVGVVVGYTLTEGEEILFEVELYHSKYAYLKDYKVCLYGVIGGLEKNFNILSLVSTPERV